MKYTKYNLLLNISTNYIKNEREKKVKIALL